MGALGLAALAYVRQPWSAVGLVLVAVYAALGFDGLGHYAVAPMALHTLGANMTILSEVAAAALLLAATLYLLWRELAKVRHSLKESPHAQQ